ncbi:DUF6343 family protein [Streptomyces sp. NBC_01716]|uniref:DUF6343 family protein n=1 Tax=Streptomyces sp. NBC_01716 TaxID=2975917 RepID=UPI002E338631|nr:DUF6343 family protein [Streptomyces sp. NBC_01716]
MRTGNEPVTARSPLRMRWWLSVWGLCWFTLGTVAFAIAGQPGWAAACGVLLLIVATDFVLVVRHMRQGSRYQPSRDVPPFEDHGQRRGGTTDERPWRWGKDSDRNDDLSRRSRNGPP